MVAIAIIVVVGILSWGGWVLHYAITQYPEDQRLQCVTCRWSYKQKRSKQLPFFLRKQL